MTIDLQFLFFLRIVFFTLTYYNNNKGICDGYTAKDTIRGPTFVSEPASRVDFSNNTGVVLRCVSDGHPFPTIEWTYADGSPVTDVQGLRRVFSNGTLVISPFNAERFRQDIHATVYKCLAYNVGGVVTSRHIQVRTVVSQLYEVHVYDEFVIAGNTAVFKCIIPSFVLDYVSVTSWIREPGITLDVSTNGEERGGEEGGGEEGGGNGKLKVMPTGELHIRNVTSGDSPSSYRCRTVHRMTGEVRISTSSGRLFVTEPPGSVPPIIYHIKGNMRVRRGDSVVMPCVAQGYPVPSYSWMKKGDDGRLKPFPILGKYQQDVDSLKVYGVQEVDSGTFVCLVNNTVGNEKGETTLFVWEPLSSYIQPKQVTSSLGESVRFHCIVGGFPRSSLRWLHDGKEVDTGHMVSVSQDILQLDSVRRDHRGMYQCVVANDDESVQASAQLRIGDLPPELHHKLTETTVQPGHNLSLKCTASGIPPPQITWHVDDQKMTNNTSTLTITNYVDKQGDVVSQVNFSSLTTHDGGEYVCSARNRVGLVSHSARVNVYGPPFVRPMGRRTTLAGSNVLIRCPYGGHPIDSIVWEKDGTRLPVDHRQVIFRNGTLLIRNVQRGIDAGKYRCLVTGSVLDHGTVASRDLEVMVLVPPNVVPFSFHEGQLKVGVRAQVFCAVSDGDLPLTLEWLKDGQPQSSSTDVSIRRIDDYTSSLIIGALGPRHNGNYTCVAANAAAVSSHSAILSVNVPPKWVNMPSDREVLTGEGISVDCQVDGAPVARITWMKAVEGSPGEYKEVSYMADYVRQLNNGTLVIREARIEDGGSYSCRATNNIGPGLSKVITITVRMPVSFDVHERNETVRKGDVVHLRCEPKGDFPIEVTWYFNNRKLYESTNSRYSIEEAVKSNGRPVFHVMATNADKKDRGTYMCEAKNVYGVAELRIHLSVLEAPRAPEGLTVLSHGSRTATFSWVPPFDDGNTVIHRYIVQISELSSPNTEKSNRAFNITVAGSESSTTVSGLEPATTYMAQVAAENMVGISEMEKPIMLTTSEEVPSGPPLDVAAYSIQPKTVKVNWKPPQRKFWNGKIIGYYVSFKEAHSKDPYNFQLVDNRGIESNGELSRAGSVLGGGGLFTYILADLKHFTKYAIVVQAFNTIGVGPTSEEIFVTTMEGVPIKPPGDVVCIPLTSQSVRVTWDAIPPSATNGNLQGYKVVYAPLDEWYANEVGEMTISVTGQQTIVIGGLQKHTNYSFQVTGYTRMGTGPRGPEKPIQCQTKEDVPDAPEEIKAMSTSSTSILVTWKTPVRPNGSLTKYNVYMRRTEDPNKEDIGKHSIPSSQTHFEADGLRSNGRYEFWVTAVTTVGEGQSTRVITQKTTGPEIAARIVSFGSKFVVPWNTNVELPCKAIGVPLPKTEWMFEGRPIEKSFQVAVNGSLLLSHVSGNNKGSYVCRSHNTYGADNITYFLKIQMPPQTPVLLVSVIQLFSLQLKWESRDDGGSPIKRYNLYHKRDYSEWENIEFAAKQTNHTLENLECGTRYQLYATATNKYGTSKRSEVLTVRTRGSPPRAPTKRSFIMEGVTTLTLYMSTWDSGGCPILYFVVQYKMMTNTDWRLVSNNVFVQPEFIIPDLNAATWYNLQVTAHNNAGSTVAHYDVTTKVALSGGTIAPRPSLIEKRGQVDNPPFYYDAKVIVLLTSIAILVVTIVTILCHCYRRQRQINLERTFAAAPRPLNEGNRQELQNTTVAGNFGYLLGSNKKPNNKVHGGITPNHCQIVNPYATSQIVEYGQGKEMHTFGERAVHAPKIQEIQGDGTFPRSRRENVFNLELAYTRPASEGSHDEDLNEGCYSTSAIYTWYPRNTQRLEHQHVPDLLEHGRESSTPTNDTHSEVTHHGSKTPDSLERRYRRRFDDHMEETTFVFFYRRDSHLTHCNSQDYLDRESSKNEFANYSKDTTEHLKDGTHLLHNSRDILEDPSEMLHRPYNDYESNRRPTIDYTIAV